MTSRALSRRRFLAALQVTVIGTLLALAMSHWLREREEGWLATKFAGRAQDRVVAIERAFGNALVTVESLAALLEASPHIDPAGFKSISTPFLTRFGSLQALGFDTVVSFERRFDHEARARSRGVEGYEIRERDSAGDLVRATDRAEYVVVEFIEPLAGNEKALGFDIASERVRRDALHRARDTGQVCSTGVLKLVQDGEDQRGILVCAPVYRSGAPRVTAAERLENIIGYSVGAFRVGDIVDRALGDFEDAEVDLHMYDPASVGGGWLYESAGWQSALPSDERRNAHMVATTIPIAGRTWSVECVPTAAFFDNSPTWGATAAFWALIALTLTIAGYIFHLTGLNERLEHSIERHSRTETELKATEEWMQLALGALDGGIWDIDFRTGAMHISPGWFRMLGYGPDELPLTKSTWEDRIHPADRERVRTAMRSVLKDSREHITIEYRLQHISGEWVSVLDRGQVIERGNDGRVFRITGTTLDITGRKRGEAEKARLESELRQSQKLEAVGTLASGVAHDFNNLLTAIEGHAERARSGLRPGQPGWESLDLVAQACDQASVVARSLLTFSNRSDAEKAPVDLVVITRDSMNMMARLLPACIELHEQYPAEPVWVEGDRNQLKQVLMNLAINSRDSMPAGGRLTVSVEEKRGDPARAVLVVADSGSGMNAEIAARVFEPFYTTKDRGKGTGLGLAVVHGIITDHNGQIRVESRAGRVTRMVVELPLSVPPTQQQLAAVPAALPREPRVGGEQLLVAEDNDLVRPLLVSALRGWGYDVLVAEDGEIASQLYRRHRDTLQVLILDLDLPKKSGLECLREVRSDRPLVPVVIVTGNIDRYSPDAKDVNLRMLGKPFPMTELKEMIEDLLVAARTH